MKQENKVEPVVFLLFGAMVIFSAVLIFCEIRFPMDGQIFQVFSGLLTGISGAFLMRIKPKGQEPAADPPAKTTTVSVSESDTSATKVAP